MGWILVLAKYLAIASTGVAGFIASRYELTEEATEPGGAKRLNRWGRLNHRVLFVSILAVLGTQILSDAVESQKQADEARLQTEMIQDIRRAVYPLTGLSLELVCHTPLTPEVKKALSKFPPGRANTAIFGAMAPAMRKLGVTLLVGEITADGNNGDLDLYIPYLVSYMERNQRDGSPFRFSCYELADDVLRISLYSEVRVSNNSGQFAGLPDLAGKKARVKVSCGTGPLVDLLEPIALTIRSDHTGHEIVLDAKDVRRTNEKGAFFAYLEFDAKVPPLEKWTLDASPQQ